MHFLIVKKFRTFLKCFPFKFFSLEIQQYHSPTEMPTHSVAWLANFIHIFKMGSQPIIFFDFLKSKFRNGHQWHHLWPIRKVEVKQNVNTIETQVRKSTLSAREKLRGEKSCARTSMGGCEWSSNTKYTTDSRLQIRESCARVRTSVAVVCIVQWYYTYAEYAWCERSL